MFPYRDENPTYLAPVVTIGIILLNALVWLVVQGAGTYPALARSVCELGAIPGELLGTVAAGTEVPVGPGLSCQLTGEPPWYTVLTSMFLHGGWFHLIGNMWFLWVFGNNIEDSMGHARYVGFYLLCGVLAALAQIFASPGSPVPMVGASGAISGIMGGYLVLYPRVRVHTLVFLGFFVTTIAVPAYFMLLFWAFLQFASSLLTAGAGNQGGVAFMAHLGGFVAGAALIRLFAKREFVARHRRQKLAYLGVLGALFFSFEAQAQAPDTAHVVIVATTDVHGRAMHWDYENDREAPFGLTRAATALDSLRRLYPGRVVLVDVGDLLQGNPFAAHVATVSRLDPNPVIDVLNVLQYDAATPGNHDFDFGLDLFGRAVEAAAFPYVSANIHRLPRDTFALQRVVTLRRGEVSIGITGFTTPGVMVWDRAQLGDRIRVRRIVPEARGALETLRGADLSVVLIHSGLDGSSSYDTTGVGPENVAAELARLPVKPDLVVVGHSHRQIRDTVIAGVHFVQPLPWARSLAVAHVWLVRRAAGAGGAGEAAARRYQVARIRGDQVPLATVTPDPGLTRRLQTVHEQVRTWAGVPIAQTDDAWSARYARVEDTPIIDLVNEVQRRTAGTELSATAAFNPQAGFGPGPVRLRDIAALYPYENTLKAVRIDGTTLVRYLERSARYFRPFAAAGPVINDSIPGFNYDIVSGVSYAIDLTRPVGERVLQVTYRGRLVQPTDTFTMALNNYRQGGGGGFEMLKNLPVVFDRGESIRDLLIQAVRGAGTLRAADYFADSWRILPPEARARIRRAPETER